MKAVLSLLLVILLYAVLSAMYEALRQADVNWWAVGGIGLALLAAYGASLPPPVKSAAFLGLLPSLFLLNPWHKGFLIDGKTRRLSEKRSYASALLVGGMGRGKSSTFVMPNLYTLDDCSLIVADSSGELHQQTSGFLAAKGFDIKTLNLMDSSASEQYNPLANLSSFTDISQAAHVIIRSSLPSTGESAFWSAGAEKIIRIMIRCLQNRQNPDEMTLSNVKFLINSFDVFQEGKGSRLNQFVLESTLSDPATFMDWKGFLRGNQRTIESFLSTADTALLALGNPDLAELTARSTIDFKALRHRKTALYVMARQQDMQFYSFVLNLFYTDLIKSLLSERNEKHLPCWLMLDEFGHLTLPGFDVFATTARKYKVGFFLFLQSLAQLESRYGIKEARTIREGLQTEIFLPGIGVETAKELERRLGLTKTPVERTGGTTYVRENLIEAFEIIQMEDDTALVLHSNLSPLKLRTRPFYKSARMRRYAQMPPHPLPVRQANGVRFVELPRLEHVHDTTTGAMTQHHRDDGGVYGEQDIAS